MRRTILALAAGTALLSGLAQSTECQTFCQPPVCRTWLECDSNGGEPRCYNRQQCTSACTRVCDSNLGESTPPAPDVPPPDPFDPDEPPSGGGGGGSGNPPPPGSGGVDPGAGCYGDCGTYYVCYDDGSCAETTVSQT